MTKNGRPYTKLSPADIPEIVKLRKSGWSYTKISKKFEVDRTTIRYHCKKYGVCKVETLFTAKKPAIKPRKPETIKKFDDLKVLKPGKMYDDYLQEKEDRGDALLKAKKRIKF